MGTLVSSKIVFLLKLSVADGVELRYLKMYTDKNNGDFIISFSDQW